MEHLVKQEMAKQHEWRVKRQIVRGRDVYPWEGCLNVPTGVHNNDVELSKKGKEVVVTRYWAQTIVPLFVAHGLALTLSHKRI